MCSSLMRLGVQASSSSKWRNIFEIPVFRQFGFYRTSLFEKPKPNRGLLVGSVVPNRNLGLAQLGSDRFKNGSTRQFWLKMPALVQSKSATSSKRAPDHTVQKGVHELFLILEKYKLCLILEKCRLN